MLQPIQAHNRMRSHMHRQKEEKEEKKTKQTNWQIDT